MLEELYTKKGTLITSIEVAQAQLQEVNKKLVEELNKKNAVAKAVEVEAKSE